MPQTKLETSSAPSFVRKRLSSTWDAFSGSTLVLGGRLLQEGFRVQGLRVYFGDPSIQIILHCALKCVNTTCIGLFGSLGLGLYPYGRSPAFEFLPEEP